MDSRKWCLWLLSLSVAFLVMYAGVIAFIDPYFHYHRPLNFLWYQLEDERYINDGILRQFDYDTVITGTSMAECFKTSDADQLFGGKSVKVPSEGASYYEICQNEIAAFKYGGHIKRIIRGLDYNSLIQDSDRLSWSHNPDYLYDDCVINDIKYLLDGNLVYNILRNFAGTLRNGGGVSSFDDYANWSETSVYGKEQVWKKWRLTREDGTGNKVGEDSMSSGLSDDEIHLIKENMRNNVISLPQSNKGTEFHYSFTPYSIYYWLDLYDNNQIDKQIDAEKIAIEAMLECDNIRLYSFNLNTELVTDLSNYRDAGHYGGWINSWILQMMKEGKYLLTKENYMDYLEKERTFYKNFDYETLRKVS